MRAVTGPVTNPVWFHRTWWHTSTLSLWKPEFALALRIHTLDAANSHRPMRWVYRTDVCPAAQSIFCRLVRELAYVQAAHCSFHSPRNCRVVWAAMPAAPSILPQQMLSLACSLPSVCTCRCGHKARPKAWHDAKQADLDLFNARVASAAGAQE